MLRVKRGTGGKPVNRAIIDIGSNTVRLVVFAGPARLPVAVLNEKVTAGLGSGVASDGVLSEASQQAALAGLRRFKLLLDMKRITDIRTVATAAARDARNGGAFLDAVRAIGLKPELLSGEEEALASASGILSAFPQADGVMGDLGGGSLELVEIAGARTSHAASFPLGTLRLRAIREREGDGLARVVEEMLSVNGWQGAAKGRTLYLVGGSWRALAHLDMHLTNFPMPIAHGYVLPPARLDALMDAIGTLGSRGLKAVPGISGSRLPMLADAAELLAIVSRRLDAARLVLSGFGLREGMLYQALDPATRRQDPLLVAAEDEGRQRGTAGWDVDRLERWIAPLFMDDAPGDARLRRAACLLSGVDLHADQDARARQGMELALLGNWIGIAASERAMLAQALYTGSGGKGTPSVLSQLGDEAGLRRAVVWGQAIRLAYRFGGGSTVPLGRARVAVGDGTVTLKVARGFGALYGEVVRKQHGALAEALGVKAVFSEG